MSAEECRVCRDGQTITFTHGESIPLCNGHWNAWLGRYLGNGDAPCAAHAIRLTT